MYVGYSENKYCLRILDTVTLRMCSDFLYHLRSQMPFHEIRVMFMFVPMH